MYLYAYFKGCNQTGQAEDSHLSHRNTNSEANSNKNEIDEFLLG